MPKEFDYGRSYSVELTDCYSNFAYKGFDGHKITFTNNNEINQKRWELLLVVNNKNNNKNNKNHSIIGYTDGDLLLGTKNWTFGIETLTLKMTQCGEHNFTCNKFGDCLPMSKRCNGVIDCLEDNSDETDCLLVTRPETYRYSHL
jgi:hypothetical protein